jgi:hypothetical protein
VIVDVRQKNILTPPIRTARNIKSPPDSACKWKFLKESYKPERKTSFGLSVRRWEDSIRIDLKIGLNWLRIGSIWRDLLVTK